MVHTIFFRVTNNIYNIFKNQAIRIFLKIVESLVPDFLTTSYFIPFILLALVNKMNGKT
jgi:hypothetical protein